MQAEQTARFVKMADKLFRGVGAPAKDIQLLNGRTFNATFRGRASAERAAGAISGALSNVRVCMGFDMLEKPVGSGTVTRRETKVWRVHGRLAALSPEAE